MRKRSCFAVAAFLVSGFLMSGCGGDGLSPPTTPSDVAQSAPGVGQAADGRTAGSAPAGTARVAPAGPNDVVDGSAPLTVPPASVASFDGAVPSATWRPLSTPVAQPVAFVGPQFGPNGSSQAGVAVGAGGSKPSATGADATGAIIAPALLPPVVDGASVTIAWVPIPGGDQPTGWRLVWSTSSEAGSFSFGVGTLSARADGVWPGNYSVTVCAVNSAGAYLDFCSRVQTFSITPQYPNPPRNLRYTVAGNGTTVTLEWDAPAQPPPVDEYVVLYQGQRIPVGGSLRAAGDLAPGTYLVGVLARNRSGESAAATITIQVVQPRGTYSGPFRATTTIRRDFTDGRCYWYTIYAGNILVTLTTQSNGSVSGSVRVSGTWSATLTSQTRPCRSASGTYNDTAPASGTRTAFSADGIDMDIATGSFRGQIVDSTVLGTLSNAYKYGSGFATWTGSLPGS
ncbi:MAG: hypothetical protein NTY02_10230 [Acidobacteria bacterium]|nr:hypothetical protein [Acidobacteriota bacterium]